MKADLTLTAPERSRLVWKGGFTLVELLVATTVLIIIVALLLQVTDQTGKIWRSATERIQAFQEARAGFDAMTRALSEATLNTYFDYYDVHNRPRSGLSTSDLGSFVPATYDRYSELHFVSGQAQTLLAESPEEVITQTHAVFFQAPRGYSVNYDALDNALNACGYFLQFDDGTSTVPDFIRNSPGFEPRYRFRMMEMTQSTEDLEVYANPNQPNDWFVKNAASNSRVIAENVIALVLLPKLPDRMDDPEKGGGVSLAPWYNYNSRIGLNDEADNQWPGASPPFPPDKFEAYPSDGVAVNSTRHHQLPPVMRMIMIVLDETSAARIQGDSTTVPAAINLANLDLFKNAAELEEDIQAVEDICNAVSGNLTGNTQKLNYRVFSTDILIRQAKWSNK